MVNTLHTGVYHTRPYQDLIGFCYVLICHILVPKYIFFIHQGPPNWTELGRLDCSDFVGPAYHTLTYHVTESVGIKSV